MNATAGAMKGVTEPTPLACLIEQIVRDLSSSEPHSLAAWHYQRRHTQAQAQPGTVTRLRHTHTHTRTHTHTHPHRKISLLKISPIGSTQIRAFRHTSITHACCRWNSKRRAADSEPVPISADLPHQPNVGDLLSGHAPSQQRPAQASCRCRDVALPVPRKCLSNQTAAGALAIEIVRARRKKRPHFTGAISAIESNPPRPSAR